MSRTISIVVLCALVGAGLYGAVAAGSFFFTEPAPDTVVCTADAMQCPDGSYVGRSGPRCEFVCPEPATSTPAATTVQTTIGKSVHALDVDIVPLEVVSDSRCPIDVECIWAGTVELKANVRSGLGTSNVVFTLGKPITTEAEQITLVHVLPAPKQNTTIAPSAYIFVFEVNKR